MCTSDENFYEAYMAKKKGRRHDMSPNTQDRRRIRLEDVTKADYIPFLGGRPARDEGLQGVISPDDVTNLKIALAMAGDLTDFIGRV